MEQEALVEMENNSCTKKKPKYVGYPGVSGHILVEKDGCSLSTLKEICYSSPYYRDFEPFPTFITVDEGDKYTPKYLSSQVERSV